VLRDYKKKWAISTWPKIRIQDSPCQVGGKTYVLVFVGIVVLGPLFLFLSSTPFRGLFCLSFIVRRRRRRQTANDAYRSLRPPRSCCPTAV